MGTIVNITVIDKDLRQAEKSCELAFREMRRIEKMLSVNNESSEISRLNQSEDLKFFKANPELIFLLKESKKYSNLTQGAFNVCIGPLVELWKEKLDKGEIPTCQEIKKIMPSVDWRNVEIDDQRNLVIFKKKGMKVNLGAIAKGYAVDQAIKVFKKNGIKNCLVEAGGDLFALGKGINRNGWRIGVKNPRKSGVILEFNCIDKGVATSGDYERFKILNKERYHHLIDPRTGFPGNEVVSVTITASDAIAADALSTAVFILGQKDGLQLIRKMKGVQGIIIVEEEGNFKIFSSQDLKNFNRKK